jgi:heterodisulfide reductase subunit A-like polyferredoxin
MISHTGHVGDFKAELLTRRSDGSVLPTRIDHGVTVVATGAQETHKHPFLHIPHVITQQELEEKILHDPELISRAKDVVMIQCVGTEGVAEYCSRVCCTNTMKNAIRLKLSDPSRQVSVLYKNIVTYGFREEYYTEARRRGVLFIRWTDENPPEVVYDNDNDRLSVNVRDLALDRDLTLPADIVSLSTSIEPSDGTADLARMLRVPLSSEGFFEEAQLKLRPMDFMRVGIFLAGMASYPKFIEESISHALAAAARALTVLTRDTLYLGGTIAHVDPDKCVGCLTCTRVCPFAIPQVITQESERRRAEAGIPTRYELPRTGVGGIGGAAFIDPAQCQGCGTCTGECPANAIQLFNYTDEQMMLQTIGGLGSWQTDLTPEVMQ